MSGTAFLLIRCPALRTVRQNRASLVESWGLRKSIRSSPTTIFWSFKPHEGSLPALGLHEWLAHWNMPGCDLDFDHAFPGERKG